MCMILLKSATVLSDTLKMLFAGDDDNNDSRDDTN